MMESHKSRVLAPHQSITRERIQTIWLLGASWPYVRAFPSHWIMLRTVFGNLSSVGWYMPLTDFLPVWSVYPLPMTLNDLWSSLQLLQISPEQVSRNVQHYCLQPSNVLGEPLLPYSNQKYRSGRPKSVVKNVEYDGSTTTLLRQLWRTGKHNNIY